MDREQSVTLKIERYSGTVKKARPSSAQLAWLRRGLDQPGGKLPLFDRNGQHYDARTIRACIEQGWAEPWFNNPLKPDWLICKLTKSGCAAASHLKPEAERRQHHALRQPAVSVLLDS